MNEIIRRLLPSKAWCLDRYGNEYKVWVHPFGSMQFESAEEDAAWLWCNGFKLVQRYCEDFLIQHFWYCYGPDKTGESGSITPFLEEISDILNELECVRNHPNLPLLINVIQQKAVDAFKLYEFSEEWIDDQAMQATGAMLTRYLNNNILRVRYGSEYQTKIDSYGTLFFRISSNEFNWTDVIYDFIDRHMSSEDIKYVTVETDEASKGEKAIVCNNVEIEDFLSDINVLSIGENIARLSSGEVSQSFRAMLAPQDLEEN